MEHIYTEKKNFVVVIFLKFKFNWAPFFPPSKSTNSILKQMKVLVQSKQKQYPTFQIRFLIWQNWPQVKNMRAIKLNLKKKVPLGRNKTHQTLSNTMEYKGFSESGDEAMTVPVLKTLEKYLSITWGEGWRNIFIFANKFTRTTAL